MLDVKERIGFNIMNINKLIDHLVDLKSKSSSGKWFLVDNPQSISIYAPCKVKGIRNDRISICCTCMSKSMKKETKERRRNEMQLIVDTMNNLDQILHHLEEKVH